MQMRVADLEARLAFAGVPLFLPLETASDEVAGEIKRQQQFGVQDPDGISSGSSCRRRVNPTLRGS